MATLTGSTVAVRTSKGRLWSIEGGESLTETWEGSRAAISAKYIALQGAAGVDHLDVKNNGGKATLTVYYADSDTAGGGGIATAEQNTVWELVPQDMFKDIRQYGGGLAGTQAFNGDGAGVQEEFERLQKLWKQGKLAAEVVADPFLTYQKLLLRNVTQYVRTAAILRSTIRIGRNSDLAAGWTGVDQAWKLDGEAGSPSPSGFGSGAIIGAIGLMAEADATKKQWLKRAPTARPLGRGRFNIGQDWWYAARWSRNQYLGDAEAGNP